MLLVFAHCHDVEQQLLAFVVSFFDQCLHKLKIFDL